MKTFIDFNDTSIPLGKRKVQYVKWLMHKYDYSLEQARLLCGRKFYHEQAQHPSGISPCKMHYLLVWSHNQLEILNCSQKTRATDEVLAELHKDEYYEIEAQLKNVKTKEEALAVIRGDSKGDEFSLEFLKSLPVSDLYVVKEVKI